MLLSFVRDFPELACEHVVSRLHPRDVLTLSVTCHCLRALRVHPAAVHARAMAPSLRAIRAIEYRTVSHSRFVSRSHAPWGFKIIRDVHPIAIRDRTVYAQYFIASTDVWKLIVRTVGNTLQRVSIFCDVDRVRVYSTQYEFFNTTAWIMHALTLVQVWRIVWVDIVRGMVERDVHALGATCGHFYHTLRPLMYSDRTI